MQVLQFIAPDAASALAQIHQQLGPDAVVLSVRPMPAQGISRLLPGSGRIEVLAGVPIAAPLEAPALPADFSVTANASNASSNGWRSVAWLEAMGLLPQHAERIQERLATVHGATAPSELEAEWSAVSTALNDFWKGPPSLDDGLMQRPHVFIGPPGCGKTTVLCKWLTLSVLTEDRCARVYRLDHSRANTADYLTIHCEMLGTPVERFWSQPGNRAELLFVDLPGVEVDDSQALAGVINQLAALPSPHIHLVLNAAYETATLLAQWHAFASLDPEDLILTHLDEERRRVKLWNLVLNDVHPCPMRFVSAGQKIPGVFAPASPQWLLPAAT